MIAVAFHLHHGFQSGFQTLGINHPKYNQAIKAIGNWVFGLIIPALFASMPLYFLIK
jgi:succinate dehydrogenase / fumarate reductase cytochrome b subunit